MMNRNGSCRRRESAAAVAATNNHLNNNKNNSNNGYDYCPHISGVMGILDVKKTKVALKKRNKCRVCLQANELWICLKCKQFYCGYGAGHSLLHFDCVRSHCIFLNTKSAKLYCYTCGEDVEPRHYDDELHHLREFVLYTPKLTTRNNNITSRQTVNRNNKVLKTGKIIMKKKKLKTTRKRTAKKSRLSKKANNGDIVNAARQAQKLQESASEPNANTKKATNINIGRQKKIVTRIRTNQKVGLINEGTSCFMNVVWQSLSNINMFTVYLEKLDYNNNSNRFKNENGYIAQYLKNVLTTLSNWKPQNSSFRNSISARPLYDIIFQSLHYIFGDYKQNDAVEFLMYILNKLDSELRQRLQVDDEKQITFSDRPTFATSMFSSMLVHEERCLGCGSLDITSRETNLVISLGIPSDYNRISTNSSVDTLTDCLERFFGVEQPQDKRVDCKVCNSKQKSTNKPWISQLPEVLCLHLSRFVYEHNQSVKVRTPIQFPMVSLDMSQYVLNENGTTVDRTDCLYDLSSVIVHKGESGTFGHYTSFHYSNHTWYECNDEKVYQVDHSIVENVEAYVLLYVKKNEGTKL